jgi:hypothetical protein
MNGFKVLALAAVAGFLLTATPPRAHAQITVQVGVAPDCPYGYYDYAPYNCVPDGYYGPEWFTGGVFLGVGPWFHGRDDFRGNVDNTFDPNHGYNGPRPKVGDKAAAQRRDPGLFKANESRDGRGHPGDKK